MKSHEKHITIQIKPQQEYALLKKKPSGFATWAIVFIIMLTSISIMITHQLVYTIRIPGAITVEKRDDTLSALIKIDQDQSQNIIPDKFYQITVYRDNKRIATDSVFIKSNPTFVDKKCIYDMLLSEAPKKTFIKSINKNGIAYNIEIDIKSVNLIQWIFCRRC